MPLTYGSAKTHAQSTSGDRLSQTLKYGYRNSERSQELLKLCVLSYLPDNKRIYQGNTRSTEQIPVGTFHSLPAVVQKQDEVGLQYLLEGRPSLGWSEVQQRYYEWIGSRRSGLGWLTALIQKLWDIAWDM
jgi:hypothetical protein